MHTFWTGCRKWATIGSSGWDAAPNMQDDKKRELDHGVVPDPRAQRHL